MSVLPSICTDGEDIVFLPLSLLPLSMVFLSSWFLVMKEIGKEKHDEVMANDGK